ncbi:SMI1/KNR4 family protein [Pseudomonas sp. Irchel s3h17]|uniref:SMI1/KNR4 family protein n=1 Tax=Pseudomonas sp. Irchel s3h17 TaxID=2009182 RepID=UPI00117A3BA0|nr:SMI1/KNR4 family protein [Pseudomonas sp. Irchel s3h17]
MTLNYTEKNPPASADSINNAVRMLGVEKNIWITKFWSLYDGALLDDQVLIYSTGEIVERNQTYDIARSFPGQILVGDDSGGRLVLTDKSVVDKFYLIGSGDPFLDDAEIFQSIDALVEHVLVEQGVLSESVDVVTIGKAKATPQEVLAIKKGLGLSSSVTDLKEKLQKENEKILKGVKAVKYERVVAGYRHLIRFDS